MQKISNGTHKMGLVLNCFVLTRLYVYQSSEECINFAFEYYTKT